MIPLDRDAARHVRSACLDALADLHGAAYLDRLLTEHVLGEDCTLDPADGVALYVLRVRSDEDLVRFESLDGLVFSWGSAARRGRLRLERVPAEATA